MEKYRSAAGYALLAVLGGLYFGYSNYSAPPAPEERSATGFNLSPTGGQVEEPKQAPPPTEALYAPAPAPVVAKKPAAAAAPAAKPNEAWVKSQSQGFYASLMSKPVDFMVKQTLLASGDGFTKFCNDPARVDRYLSHPVVRAIIDNPKLLRTLLGSQAVVNGFLGSPAMQDPRAVSAMAKSPLLRKISNDPGIQKVLGEPGVISGIFANPNTMRFLSSHPDAMAAFSHMSPAASAAVGRR